ncbi:MAG: RNA methyltransferase [Prevotella sp.]|nr:RNA methyltransferase [Prevotella sp.]
MISKSQQKLIRSLELKKYRQREGLFVAEGPKVVGDLLRRAEATAIYATSQWIEHNASVMSSGPQPTANIHEVSPSELQHISFLQHPQQVLGLFALPRQKSDAAMLPTMLRLPTCELVLALDGVQDPGNLGTIIRLADWFGIGTILCSLDTADAWSPKVVQATMGSIARVNVVYTDLKEWLSHLPADVPVYGTMLDGTDIYRKQLTRHGVIIMGNEGNGISEQVAARVSHRLLVPSFSLTPDDTAESLNVAIATAVTCAEFRRQQHETT